MTVVYGPEIVEWVSMGLFGVPDYLGNATALGFIRDKLIGGVVYNNYRLNPDGSPLSIEMSIYTVDKRWATKHNLREIFAYPFIQLGLERVQITTHVDNEGVNSVVSRLGYKKEGLHRKAFPYGGDAYSWSMLKNECVWIK